MSDLKPGWQRVKFGELANCINDRVDDPSTAGVDRYVGLEHLDPESLTIRRWGSPEDVESTKLRFIPGDIIFGKRRAYQRKLAVADFEGICSAHAMVLRAKPAIVLPEFLAFFMQSNLFMERAVEISVGSLSPTINWKTLAQQEFELPPQVEQLLFVDCLSSICKSLNSLEDVIKAQKHVLVSSRRELFGAEKGLPARSALALADICVFLDHVRVPLSGSVRQTMQGDYPYYGASGVIDRIDRYLFEEPLLLISEDGANLISRTTPIAFVADGKYWVNNHAHVVRAQPPWTNDLLAAYIETIRIQQFISGTAQPKLTRAACEEIPVPELSETCIFELLGIEAEFELATKWLARRTDELKRLKNMQLMKLCGMTT